MASTSGKKTNLVLKHQISYIKRQLNTAKSGSDTDDVQNPKPQQSQFHAMHKQVNLFATCDSSTTAQNVLQLVEVLNEGKSLLHETMSVNIPHRRHRQLNANIILTHAIWVRSSISTITRSSTNIERTACHLHDWYDSSPCCKMLGTYMYMKNSPY